ncbi:MAG: hypothetical protein Q7S86_02620 [bacterium]|nr:hypothetical protein [bacterium]
MKALDMGDPTSGLIEQVDLIIKQALKLDKTRTGGYFCLADRSGMPLLIVAVGEVADNEKAVRYFVNAQEKCRRLTKSNTWLASDTRDTENGKYGGAMKGHDYIYGFSGLPEDLDEAAMIILCANRHDLPILITAEALAEKSQNQFFSKLRFEVRRAMNLTSD